MKNERQAHAAIVASIESVKVGKNFAAPHKSNRKVRKSLIAYIRQRLAQLRANT